MNNATDRNNLTLNTMSFETIFDSTQNSTWTNTTIQQEIFENELHLKTDFADDIDNTSETVLSDWIENVTSLDTTFHQSQIESDIDTSLTPSRHDDGDEITPNWWLYIRGCIVTLVTVTIIASNIINLNVWWRNTKMPWAARRFLINLSSCDLIVGLIATSSAIYPAFTGRWPYGDAWCQISGITHGISVCLSIWSIAMVSLDRYIATTRPFDYTKIMSRTCSSGILIGMWTAAALSFISPLFTKAPNFIYYQYSDVEAMCGLYWEYREYCIITGIYIPGLSGTILGYTSYKIHKNLAAQKVDASLNDAKGKQISKQRIETNKRALKIIIATSTCYFISWGPYSTIAVLNAISPSVFVLPDKFMFVLMWVANANSMLNVFIYSFTNKYFQAEAKAMFGFNKSRNRIAQSSFTQHNSQQLQTDKTLPTST